MNKQKKQDAEQEEIDVGSFFRQCDFEAQMARLSLEQQKSLKKDSILFAKNLDLKYVDKNCKEHIIPAARLSQVLGSAMKQSGHVIIVTCQKLPYSF